MKFLCLTYCHDNWQDIVIIIVSKRHRDDSPGIVYGLKIHNFCTLMDRKSLRSGGYQNTLWTVEIVMGQFKTTIPRKICSNLTAYFLAVLHLLHHLYKWEKQLKVITRLSAVSDVLNSLYWNWVTMHQTF